MMFFFSISRAEVKPILEELLVNLFKAFEIRGSEENEYVMKGKDDAFYIRMDLDWLLIFIRIPNILRNSLRGLGVCHT
jgi:hypothetical protein